MASGPFDSLGTSFGPVATYALAAIVVFVLLMVVLAIAKRTLRPGTTNPGLRRGPRLAIIDVAAVDQRRKLVLLRRDDVEHLVLIGGQNDLVVEEGILRTPSAVQSMPGERQSAARSDTTGSLGMNGRPAVVAPDPRLPHGDSETARAASPLRRTLPQQPMQRQPAPQAEPREEPVVAAAQPQKPVEPALPAARPAPLLEPAIVAEAPEPPTRQPAPSAPKPVALEPQRSTPPPPVEMPEIFMPDRSPRPEANEPSPPRERPDVAQPAKSVAVPAFLQRGEAPAESREEAPKPAVAPTPAMPVAPPPAPPVAAPRVADFERAPVRSEPVPVAISRNERPAAAEPPLFPRAPVAVGAPLVKPDAPFPSAAVPSSIAESPARVEPQPEEASSAPEPEAPTVEPLDDADRRPLSVRSFASAIQSRRTVPDVTAQPRPVPSVERPQERFRTTATPTLPVREAPPAVSPPVVRSTAPDDGGLEEALSRELDSDLGSLDWDDEPRTRPSEKPVAVKPPSPPVSAPLAAEPQKAERRPTLEEEMERLLSDFDFGPPRR